MKTLWGRFLVLSLGLLASGLYAQPVITNQPAGLLVVAGGNATFSVMATGTGPFTYQWQLNGTNLPNNIITTVAGGNLFNNLPATNTILNLNGAEGMISGIAGGLSAGGVTIDSAGNLFVADTFNNVVRKVGTNGMATIVAGNGSAYYAGDGGAATNAGLWYPSAVSVDSHGSLFIADSFNHRIRKVDTNGVIITVAGNGIGSYAGDSGAATNAELNKPQGVCVDAKGNLFIADAYNGRFRKVDTNGTITTLYSQGVNNLSLVGVVVDNSNNLYVADNYAQQVLKLNTNNPPIVLIAGTNKTSGYAGDGGAATNATMNDPLGIAADAVHDMFITDSSNNCIRKVGTNGIISTVAGNGANGFFGDGGLATNANLSHPQGVAVDSLGNLFIADSGNNRIRKVDTNGYITTVVGRNLNDGDQATNAGLNSPYATAFDASGNFYIAEFYGHRIRKADTNGVITTVAGNGYPAFSGDGGAATNASLHRPGGVAVDASGNLFIADGFNRRVREVDTNGNISTVAGTGSWGGGSFYSGAATNARLGRLFGVSVDAFGNLFVLDFDSKGIEEVATNGSITTFGATSSFDSAMAPFTGASVFVADNSANRIFKYPGSHLVAGQSGGSNNGFTGDGGLATSALLSHPLGVTADAAGNFFIADTSNYRIRKVDTNGIINTIAGNGVQGFAGDGGAGNNAEFVSPQGLSMDGIGNVYIADTGNNRIRKLAYVDYADQPSFTVTNVSSVGVSNSYSVIITSASGSVTSSVANLTVVLPGYNHVAGQLLGDGTMQLAFVGIAGGKYALDSTVGLSPANWLPQATNTADALGNLIFTNAPDPTTNAFWRLRSVP